MTVQELIDIVKEYNPDAKVRIAVRPYNYLVNKIKPCVMLRSNVVNMCIYVEE